MEAEKITHTLQEWKPEESHHFGPSKEGLGRELGGAVKLKPEKFDKIANLLKNQDPTYVRSYLQAFHELAQNNMNFGWDAILDLCVWVVAQPLIIPGRKGALMDQDPDWSWTRKSISSLLVAGMNRNLIPFNLREKVWDIIEPLTYDPNPSPEDEEKDEGSNQDPYGLAVNSSRGEAISAVMEYCLWVHRSSKNVGKPIEKMPKEVEEILNLHLDPTKDPSVAVRSIYGRYFPWLLIADKNWTIENITKIFPSGEYLNPLYQAAWETMLLYGPAYDAPFEVLRNQYFEAVRGLGKTSRKKNRHTDQEERLAEHLMIYYLRGKIDIDDELLSEFWKYANDDIRSHALSFVGRVLKSESFDKDTLGRSMNLWEKRIEEAKNSPKKVNYEKETSSFGWWFSSGKLDEKWTSDQYLEALEIGKKLSSDYFVMEQLEKIVKTLPSEAVKILSKLVLVEEPGWTILGNKEKIKSVLTTALSAPEKEAKELAKELINRLLARGYGEFNDLI